MGLFLDCFCCRWGREASRPYQTLRNCGSPNEYRVGGATYVYSYS